MTPCRRSRQSTTRKSMPSCYSRERTSDPCTTLAEEFGWSLVQAAARTTGVHQTRLLRPKTVIDMLDQHEKEFEELEACVSLLTRCIPTQRRSSLKSKRRNTDAAYAR